MLNRGICCACVLASVQVLKQGRIVFVGLVSVIVTFRIAFSMRKFLDVHYMCCLLPSSRLQYSVLRCWDMCTSSCTVSVASHFLFYTPERLLTVASARQAAAMKLIYKNICAYCFICFQIKRCEPVCCFCVLRRSISGGAKMFCRMA